MAFDTTPINQDTIVLKADYDRLMANTVENRYLVRGYFGLSLSNLNNNLEPQIIGRIEVGGEVIIFNSLTTITGWVGIGNNNDVYVKVTPSATSEFTISAPTWDNTKQGWYSGTDRYVFKLRKDGTGQYTDKRAMLQEKIIDTAQIRDRAVTSAKLAPGIVFGGEIPIGGLILAAFDGRPGSPLPYGIGVPANYLYCDGSSLVRASYMSLYNKIGVTYGEGLSPGTTFALPDYRGKFFRVQADSQSADPDRAARSDHVGAVVVGDQIGSFQWHAIQYHRHGADVSHNSARDKNNITKDGNDSGAEDPGSLSVTILDPTNSPLAIPVRTSIETRPTNIYIQVFIRYI
jgi:microcystin-dependent protein